MDTTTELAELVGLHVFAEYTYQGRTTVVKGLVLGITNGRLKLKLTGNGPKFDGKKITCIIPELQTTNGKVMTAEADGDPPGLGRWRE